MLRIWFDILVPKDLLFFDQMIRRLRKNHEVLCTSRRYGEVSRLARVRGTTMRLVGSFGGPTLYSKLEASIQRSGRLLPIIREFSPEAVVSFCSPEAARISFGLGVRHIGFTDTPYSPVLRLCIPLSSSLLTPWLIPKNVMSGMGMAKENIIQYRAIDAAITLRATRTRPSRLPTSSHKKNILVRSVEEQASYQTTTHTMIPILQLTADEFPDENIIAITRYPEQYRRFRAMLPNNVRVIRMSYDGRDLLENSDIFVGSGGTMTAESALMGVPTVSYNAVPNVVERFLVRNRLAVRETDPVRVVQEIKRLLEAPRDTWRRRAKRVMDTMEDPYPKLLDVLEA